MTMSTKFLAFIKYSDSENTARIWRNNSKDRNELKVLTNIKILTMYFQPSFPNNFITH